MWMTKIWISKNQDMFCGLRSERNFARMEESKYLQVFKTLTSSEVRPRRRFLRRGSRLSAAQQPKGVGRAPFLLFLSSSLYIAANTVKFRNLS